MLSDEATAERRNTDALPTWVVLRLGLLVAFQFGLQLAMGLSSLPSFVSELTFLQTQTAIHYAGLALLALWCGLSTARPLVRVLGTAGGCALTAAFIVMRGEYQTSALVAMTGALFLFTILTAGVVLWWRYRQSHLSRFENPQSLPVPENQFSLKQLLGGMTLVAVFLGLLKLVAARQSGMGLAQVSVAIVLASAMFGINALGPLWAVLTPGPPLRRVLPVLVTILFLNGSFVVATNTDLLDNWRTLLLKQATLMTLSAVLITLSLFVVRSCGYCLVRRSPIGAGYFRI